MGRQVSLHFVQHLVLHSLLVAYLASLEVFAIAVYPQGLNDAANREQMSMSGENVFTTEEGATIEMFPHPDSTHYQPWNTTSSRRKLGDFLGCAYCKCCNAEQTYCQAALPCCYSINCDAYPFGFCKFVPISCNCQGCGV